MNLLKPRNTPTDLVIDIDRLSVTFDESSLSLKDQGQSDTMKLRLDKLVLDDATASTVTSLDISARTAFTEASSASDIDLSARKRVSFGSISIWILDQAFGLRQLCRFILFTLSLCRLSLVAFAQTTLVSDNFVASSLVHVRPHIYICFRIARMRRHIAASVNGQPSTPPPPRPPKRPSSPGLRRVRGRQ